LARACGARGGLCRPRLPSRGPCPARPRDLPASTRLGLLGSPNTRWFCPRALWGGTALASAYSVAQIPRRRECGGPRRPRGLGRSPGTGRGLKHWESPPASPPSRARLAQFAGRNGTFVETAPPPPPVPGSTLGKRAGQSRREPDGAGKWIEGGDRPFLSGPRPDHRESAPLLRLGRHPPRSRGTSCREWSVRAPWTRPGASPWSGTPLLWTRSRRRCSK